jgi:hypothetical protein
MVAFVVHQDSETERLQHSHTMLSYYRRTMLSYAVSEVYDASSDNVSMPYVHSQFVERLWHVCSSWEAGSAQELTLFTD